MKRLATSTILMLLGVCFLGTAEVLAQNVQTVVITSPNKPVPSLQSAISASRLQAPSLPSDFLYEVPNRPFVGKEDTRTVAEKYTGPDLALQTSYEPGALTTVHQTFDGASNDDNAAVIGFRISPPDTDGDVGPNHYVQMINLVTTVYDKSGNALGGGSFAGNLFWSGFSDQCGTTNRGDPIVLYDETEDRWLVSQFAFDTDVFGNPTPPFLQCIAVSQTGDPLGGYNAYSFDFSAFGFNDYPKHGITSESITMMANLFIPPSFPFGGTLLAAFDKQAMYDGDPANVVASNIGGAEFGFVAGDLDDPAGTAGFVPALFATAMSRNNLFDIWEIDVNWASPGSATTNRIAGIPIDPFDSTLCGATRGRCIPQPSPGNPLESLAGRLMHRLQIRDFGTYRTMLASHTVDINNTGRAGIRWYEMRESGGNWSLHQSGTYAPSDGEYRWMPSIAMNASGDIGLGFMLSSTSTFVSIGTVTQTAAASGTGAFDGSEEICLAGSGALSGSSTGNNRSGDYSATNVDPLTDTFWHTNEYIKAPGGNFVWHTGVCEFETGGVANNPPVVAITAPADGSSFNQGDPVTFTGTANDTEDGNISASINWSSNLDGPLGSGSSITTSTLSTGTHTVTASATDSGSLTGTDQIDVTIVGPSGTDIHVENIVTGTQASNGPWKYGTATVTIFDDLGNPVSGATVQGTFSGTINETASGTTGSNGTVTLVTNGRTKSNNPTINFCVDDVIGSLPYDENDNASPSFDCGGGGGTPTDVHVEAISTGQQGVGGGNKRGTATVTIWDDLGNPASGYAVTGTFSGDFNESASGTTGSNGTVTLLTQGTGRGKINVSFCVDTVSGALPYDPNDNPSSSFDCGTAKQGLAGADVPDGFSLEQNYPNPFNPTTVIAYTLGEASPVTLKVYNVLGQEVVTLVAGYNESGRHEVTFDAAHLSAGIYVYVLDAGAFTATQRLTLLK